MIGRAVRAWMPSRGNRILGCVGIDYGYLI